MQWWQEWKYTRDILTAGLTWKVYPESNEIRGNMQQWIHVSASVVSVLS